VNPGLLGEFDRAVSQLGQTRSNAIQMAMRDFLTEHKWTLEPEDAVAGAMIMIFEHDVKGISETLTHIQHHYIEVISSTTHVHLDERSCLEIIAFKGTVKNIKKLAKHLMTTKGVKQVKIATLKP